jgi:S1-C subfamily serine protease
MKGGFIGMSMKIFIYFSIMIILSFTIKLPISEGQFMTTSEIHKAFQSSVVQIEIRAPEVDGGGVEGNGSGIIVRENGFIITNYHVIRNVEESPERKLSIHVIPYTKNGQTLATNKKVSIISVDKDIDVALLRMFGDKYESVILGDSNEIEIGDDVVVLGFPVEKVSGADVVADQDVGKNVLSGLDTISGNFKTKVVISPGNSGGPVFDMKGQVVAIACAGDLNYPEKNHAVPINYANNLLSIAGIPTERKLIEEKNERIKKLENRLSDLDKLEKKQSVADKRNSKKYRTVQGLIDEIREESFSMKYQIKEIGVNSRKIKELADIQSGCYAHKDFTHYLFKRLRAHIEFDAFEEHLGKDVEEYLGKDVLICDLPR